LSGGTYGPASPVLQVRPRGFRPGHSAAIGRRGLTRQGKN